MSAVRDAGFGWVVGCLVYGWRMLAVRGGGFGWVVGCLGYGWRVSRTGGRFLKVPEVRLAVLGRCSPRGALMGGSGFGRRGKRSPGDVIDAVGPA
jgi:hypothetical protein